MAVGYAGDPVAEVEALARLAPEVRAFVLGTFGGLTPPQRAAVPEVLAGRNVLVAAPTGSGKTLAAFLGIFSELLRAAASGPLPDEVLAVYVSPLKALNNDVDRNLRAPLAAISDVFLASGRAAPEVRVAVRTGDTPASTRARMLRKPPHVLITTPESLSLVLASPKLGAKLAGVRWVVVDEVHALAERKRGTDLALSLERLAAVAREDPVRIGLSATIAPLERVGAFLFGARDGVVADVSAAKRLSIRVSCPVDDPAGAPASVVRAAFDAAVRDLVATRRTAIVFTNTRNATERLSYRLREDAEDPEERDRYGAHHGSLSREVRLGTEERLKRGEMRCVVTSTSLELGIDVGSVDVVAQLGSPKSATRMLQRVGRAGHNLEVESEGHVLAADRDELVESVVVAREARARRPEPVRIPEGCLDVLTQHLLAISLAGPATVEGATALVRRSYPFRNLEEADVRACLEHLAGLRGGRAARIRYDAETGTFVRRGYAARAVYCSNAGTIPSSAMVKVFSGATYVGELEESFVEGLDPGDVFALDGRPWRFLHAYAMRVQADPAPGREPTVPRWGVESLPLPPTLAVEVARFRDRAASLLRTKGEEALVRALVRDEGLDDRTASVVARYFAEQEAFSSIPASDEVLVETFVDDESRRILAFHASLGRRANEALARAFARTLAERLPGGVGVVASDRGFALAFDRGARVANRDVRALFDAPVEPRLVQALEGGELLKRRFRHVAERSLLLLRRVPDGSRSVGDLHVSSRKLHAILRRTDPEHPVLREAWREVLRDALDVDAAEALLASVRGGRVRVVFARRRASPSPFAFHLVARGSDDGVLAGDRRTLLADLQDRVREELRKAEGAG